MYNTFSEKAKTVGYGSLLFAKSGEKSIPFPDLGDLPLIGFTIVNLYPSMLLPLNLGHLSHNLPSEGLYKQCCYFFPGCMVKRVFIAVNVAMPNPCCMHINHLPYCLAQDKCFINDSYDRYLLFLLSHTLDSLNSTVLLCVPGC